MNKHEQIYLKTRSGRVLKFDCIASELFQLLSTTLHNGNTLRQPYTNQPPSIAYCFITLSLIWRHKLLSDEDFLFFGRLSVDEQYTIATQYTKVCWQLIQISATAKVMITQLDTMLQEYNKKTD